MVVWAKAAVPSVQALVAAQPCTILTGVLAFQGTVQALATFQPTFEQVRLLAVALVHLKPTRAEHGYLLLSPSPAVPQCGVDEQHQLHIQGGGPSE